MMKRSILFPVLLTLASTPLAARPIHDHAGDSAFFDRARVVEVNPIIEVIETPHEQRDCWTEEVSGTRTRRDHGGTLVGGILGGVIGHHIGRGDGASTAAGTIIGAAVGNNADRHGHDEPYHHTEQHCEVREVYHQEERINGYRVTYRYNGETYTTRMQHEPGKFLRLRVKLMPVD